MTGNTSKSARDGAEEKTLADIGSVEHINDMPVVEELNQTVSLCKYCERFVGVNNVIEIKNFSHFCQLFSKANYFVEIPSGLRPNLLFDQGQLADVMKSDRLSAQLSAWSSAPYVY